LGILWPHSNAIAFNNAGTRAPGAKVYFFEAGTTTPRTSYADAALATPHTHPVLADGNGRFPAIFLDYGDYRERVRSAGDTTLWDTDSIPNAAPVDPGEGVDADAIFQTGDYLFVGRNGSRDGFVRCNGRTIGSATSGATERANADCEDLFLHVWNNYAATLRATVSGGGPGASASADWTANKRISLPDHRSAALIGFDDMGSSAAGLAGSSPVVSGSATLAGSLIGANTHTLSAGELPSHLHSVALTSGSESSDHAHSVNIVTSTAGAHSHTINITDPGHQHTTGTGGNSGLVASIGSTSSGSGPQYVNNGTLSVNGNTTGIAASSVSAGDHSHNVNGSTSGVGATHTHLVSGNTGNTGSGSAHNTMQRSVPVTVLMKL
jgi:hypothetical protein